MMEQRIQVLLVDDDRASREGLGRYLRLAAGFEVKECPNGQDALKALREMHSRCTAILLDFVLSPSMPGDKLLAEVRKRYPRIPVIVFTGLDPRGGAEAIEKGAYRYMRRPIDRPRMVSIIRNIAEQNKTYRQMAQDMHSAFRSDLCLAWRADRRERALQVVGLYSHDEQDTSYRQSAAINLHDPAWQEFFGHEHPVYISGTTHIPSNIVYPHWAGIQEKGWKAAIAVPLVLEHRVLGLLESYYRDEWSGREAELNRIITQMLPPFASQAAGSARAAEFSDQLQALSDINQIVAGTFDDKTIIRQVLSRSIALIGATSGQIYDLEIESGQLQLREHVGVDDEAPKKTFGSGEGLAGQVARTGETQYTTAALAEVVDRPASDPFTTTPSIIAVPLRREEQTIGVLQVRSPHPNAFISDDIDLLNSVAAQAATAIGRTTVLGYSADVSRLALSGNPSDLAEHIVNAAHSLTGADVILWEVRAEEGQLEPLMHPLKGKGDLDPEYLQKARTPIAPGTSITALALEHKAPVVRRDIQDPEEAPGEPRFYNLKEAQRRNWHAFMAVPLIGRGGDRIGSLNLHGQETAKFGQSEVALMQTFARQMAIAMENARLIERLNTQLRGLHRIVESTNEDEALRSVVESLGKVFPGAVCAIRLYDADKMIFGKWVSADSNPSKWQLPPRSEGTTWYVIQNKKPLYIEDISERPGDEHPTIRDEFLKLSVKAIAHVPIIGSSQTIAGVLYVDLFQPYHFTESDKLVLGIFASQAFVAIENARLYAQLSLRAKQLQVLPTIYERIIAVGIDYIDRLFDLLYAVASEVVDLRDAQVQFVLYDAQKNEVIFPLAVEQDDGQLIDKIRWGVRECVFVRPGELEAVPAFQPRLRGSRFGLTEYVIHTQKPILISESFWEKASALHVGEQQVRVLPTFGRLERATHSWLGVPMIVQERVIGIISIQSLEQERAFDQEQIDLLSTVANQAGVAIEHARLYARMKELQEDLQRAERLVVQTRWAASYVHRVNNIVGTIPIRVRQIKTELRGDPDTLEKVAPYLNGIVDDARRVSPMVDDWNRLIAEEQDKRESLDVADALARIARRVRLESLVRIRLEESYPDEPVIVECVVWQLLDALYNLLKNAAEAMEQDGTLSLAVFPPNEAGDRFVHICMHNTGPKILESDRTKLFSLGRSRKKEGIGYGLWSAQNTIEKDHGGSLTWRNDENDSPYGVTWYVELPVRWRASKGKEVGDA
jgi:GAF domain-containing protein